MMQAEQNMSQVEQIVIKAKFNAVSIVFSWIAVGILWILVIVCAASMNNVDVTRYGTSWSGYSYYSTPSPTAMVSQIILEPSITFALAFTVFAIMKTINLCKQELVLTNKKIFGKIGIINTKSVYAPLNKVQSVSLSSGLGGKIFGYGTIKVVTAGAGFKFKYVKDIDYVNSIIMQQIDLYEQQESISHANEIARGIMMAQGINNKS